MTDDDLIHAIGAERADNDAIDIACLDRLREAASDHGRDGQIARQLLDIVQSLIGL